ncbi:E2F transcription factor-like E2FE isoform X2 [Elaeis guineensis]|uniref:E2F transcription factor-like E2FE isoform X2 n=1 Tax=Elaeis guineensis var. tenera TaxID=51953 RepID=A0A6J0PE71_ELAGV|nr:E2F transcription factor-like E2FE isoform X2 [Elaeis guineensis]
MASLPSPFLESGCRHHTYSRKQKSLGLLCSNFVSLYDRDDVESVGLDDAARRLGVERRRIYDIVNVLESVGVLARKAKNRYSWIGFSGIPKALDELKEEALKEISGTDGQCVKVLEDEDEGKLSDQNGNFGDYKPSPAAIGAASSLCTVACKARSVTDNRREKSLGLLTQNFVKLFLTTDVSPPPPLFHADTVSLDEAARLLLGDGHDSSQMRTKVRRLYDIANVLSSMNLIEKTQQLETRKPAFRWLGTKGKPKADTGVTVAIPPATKQWNKRAFGNDITNVDHKRSKLNNPVDKKPSKACLRSDDLKECNLTAQKQLQSSKGSYVFGPFRPAGVTKRNGDVEEKGGNKVQDWESLASSFRPQYHNQALSELFVHYVEAWKSWYVEVAQGSSNFQQPRKSVINQLL